MKKILIFLIVCTVSTTLLSASPIYRVAVHSPLLKALHTLNTALENEHLYIIAKADIGGTLARMKGKLGKHYNTRHYDRVKSIIFCNPFYANDIMNADPTMMALCPLKIMLMEKNGKTTALFVRPTALSVKSPAHNILKEVEQKVKRALQSAGFR